MHQFFTSPSNINNGKITIENADINHLKNVLRMKQGERIKISDGAGGIYICSIDCMQDGMVSAKIEEEYHTDTELPSKIYLFQGLPKGEKMEWIIQKAVELGVHEIIPVATKRAVVKLDDKKAAKKIIRWNAIAKGAAQQSGRGMIPEVHEVLTFGQALEYAKNLDVKCIPYELAEGMSETKAFIEGLEAGKKIGIFIGPEGGFEETEIQAAKEVGIVPITLGKRILRTETAAVTVLSIFMYQLESL